MNTSKQISPWKRLCLGFITWQTRNLMSWTTIRNSASVRRCTESMAKWSADKRETASILRHLVRNATILGIRENILFTMRAKVAQCRNELTQ